MSSRELYAVLLWKRHSLCKDNAQLRIIHGSGYLTLTQNGRRNRYKRFVSDYINGAHCLWQERRLKKQYRCTSMSTPSAELPPRRQSLSPPHHPLTRSLAHSPHTAIRSSSGRGLYARTTVYCHNINKGAVFCKASYDTITAVTGGRRIQPFPPPPPPTSSSFYMIAMPASSIRSEARAMRRRSTNESPWTVPNIASCVTIVIETIFRNTPIMHRIYIYRASRPRTI